MNFIITEILGTGTPLCSVLDPSSTVPLSSILSKKSTATCLIWSTPVVNSWLGVALFAIRVHSMKSEKLVVLDLFGEGTHNVKHRDALRQVGSINHFLLESEKADSKKHLWLSLQSLSIRWLWTDDPTRTDLLFNPQHVLRHLPLP